MNIKRSWNCITWNMTRGMCLAIKLGFCPYRAHCSLYTPLYPGRCPGLCASAPSGRTACKFWHLCAFKLSCSGKRQSRAQPALIEFWDALYGWAHPKSAQSVVNFNALKIRISFLTPVTCTRHFDHTTPSKTHILEILRAQFPLLHTKNPPQKHKIRWFSQHKRHFFTA